MKKTTCVVATGLVALMSLPACNDMTDAKPAMAPEELKISVQGKWAIEGITSRLCRENSCNSMHYEGTYTDSFEFKGDSAYITRIDSQNIPYKESYKADYRIRGVILLSKRAWAGKFNVEELQTNRLVLKSEFTGRDPAAVFTDTYYLKR